MWTGLCGFCMALMLWYASEKTIVIADVSHEAGLSAGAGQRQDAVRGLVLQSRTGPAGNFYVSLPDGVKPENVVMENRYMTRELWIYIQGGQEEFYENHPVYGDVGGILAGSSQTREDGVLLKFEMAQVQEYRSTLEKNLLTVACYDPRELYRFLVVLDPAGGSQEASAGETEVRQDSLGDLAALEVAKQIQRDFAVPGVRLYLTRTEDRAVEEGARAALAEAVDADLYIRISAQQDEAHPELYGIEGFYNDDYFIPGFGNVDLADIVTRQAAIAASNRAVGLTPAREDSILRQLSMAAMEVSVGYLSNPQEKALLEQESYRQKLAEGILQALEEACGRLGQLGEEQE